MRLGSYSRPAFRQIKEACLAFWSKLTRKEIIFGSLSGLLLFVIIFIAANTSSAPTQSHQNKPVTSGAAGVPLMWVLKDEDTTIYLFGSFHILPDKIHWMDKRLYQVFDNADEVWFELPDIQAVKNITGRELTKAEVLMRHPTLSQGLDEAEKGELYDILRRYGIPSEYVDYIRPDIAIGIIEHDELIGSGFERDEGVETVLDSRARALNKPVKGFETLGFQTRLLADIERRGRQKGAPTLKDALKDHGGGDIEHSTFVQAKAWAMGDEVHFAKMLEQLKIQDPYAYEHMLVRRNLRWVPKIEAMLDKKGTVFIAVGTGHLVGPDSVIAKLRADGYVVDPVK